VSFKHQRLGPRLVEAARSGDRYRDVHVVLGGTGAVGGSAILHLLSLYEEMFSVANPADDEVPFLVATGASPEEIGAFTRRLFRFVESQHGPSRLPRRVRRGYLARSGVFVALERFAVGSLPGLEPVLDAAPPDRQAAARAYLHELGVGPHAGSRGAFHALAAAIDHTRPFTRFLQDYRAAHLERLGVERFRSVTLGIPIPSLIAYQQGHLQYLADHIEGMGQDDVDELKERFVVTLRDDLVEVRSSLADEVLIAHTTGVGGMHDEHQDGTATIRAGFAHAGLDRFLASKQRFADELTGLYSQAGMKVLITAAAIGVDEIRVRHRIPLHRQIREHLRDAPVEVFPGSKGSGAAPEEAGRRGGRRRGEDDSAPGRQTIRVFPPLTVSLDDPAAEDARFQRGRELTPAYAVRSGENGFFSVANADALYRVMRVASAGELGLVLASVGLLGDDPVRPWFPGNVCYYTETDNARQVFDFLSQPPLLAAQLSGVEPGALQDLGSAKHQAELHTLALLILLHRLRTLDVDAIDPYVDLEHFDPEGFLLEHSRPLTFEDVAAWEFERLVADLATMAGAESPEGLMPLTPPREHGLFPDRREALRRVLERALLAVWTPPSLGSPIVFERDGAAMVRLGYYVAPLDLLVTHTDAIATSLRKAHADSGNPCSYEDFRDYHMTVGGFVDLRPLATVVAARSDAEDLRGRVARFTDEDALRQHLWGLEPYSFFSTSGLLALVFRLRGLYAQLREAMLELGTLQGYRWQMPRDSGGHVLVVPGVVEAFRMVAEGIEKATGTERLDGIWGYEPRPVPDRLDSIPGVKPPDD
jgi:hypothetical protein